MSEEPVDKGTLLDLERMFDKRDELRQRVDRNADLYRRDVQYALDLFHEVLTECMTAVEARNVLRHVYAGGRKELADWRLGEGS